MTRTWGIGVASAAVLVLASALAQERGQGTASVPDFSGFWGNPYLYGIEPPLSGPGPVVNKSRRRQGFDIDGRRLPPANAPLVSSAIQLVGDYTNPILNPTAAEVVKKRAEMSLAGLGYPSPRNQCWPEGVPFIFTNSALQLLQQPDKITLLYDEDHEVRRVRMNAPHPAPATPSWYGDSVGHYDGDTLVIDTVGFKIGPFSAVDQYGTPFTQALHVVERYRLIDYETARAAWERGAKENSRPGLGIAEGWAPDPADKGKGLQLQFTVEDQGVFTTPWSATKTYRRVLRDWPEQACAENPHKYGTEKDPAVPAADKPDFLISARRACTLAPNEQMFSAPPPKPGLSAGDPHFRTGP